MPRRDHALGGVPAADQVEGRERPGPVALGDVVGGLSGPLVLVRLDLGQGPVEREPPRAARRRNTAACALVGFRRSRTLAVLVAETGLLTGVTVPHPTGMAPTPISHISWVGRCHRCGPSPASCTSTWTRSSPPSSSATSPHWRANLWWSPAPGRGPWLPRRPTRRGGSECTRRWLPRSPGAWPGPAQLQGHRPPEQPASGQAGSDPGGR